MIRSITLAGLILAGMISAATAGPKCTCRYQNANYQIGEIACILGKLKQCEMTLNNTSWKTLSDGCPQAALQQSIPRSADVVAESGGTVVVGQGVLISGQAVN